MRRKRTKRTITLPILLGLAVASALVPHRVAALGGLFRGQRGVDGAGVRVAFRVGDDGTTRMLLDLQYEGPAREFSWLMPLREVPSEREVLPAGTLDPLDEETGARFEFERNCSGFVSTGGAGGEDGTFGGTAGASGGDLGWVETYVLETLGPYELAVIGGDPISTVAWLRDHGYRVTRPMEPYLRLYSALGMPLLALRLRADADQRDIAPIQLNLGAVPPWLPLRLTTLSSAPEMSVKVWLFASGRYAPANASEVDIDLEDLRWDGNNLDDNNWETLVSKGVDAAGGRGWVVEQAGPVDDLLDALAELRGSDLEELDAREALVGFVGDAPYLTLLHSRLSPGEMIYDPVFGPSLAADVARTRLIEATTDNCNIGRISPCERTTCGSLGHCVEIPEGDTPVAACACIEGATARSLDRGRLGVSSFCVDQRLSFDYRGVDRELDVRDAIDGCNAVDCGVMGRCVEMNLGPSCECRDGSVARAWIDDDGHRQLRCIEADFEVPERFEALRLPERPIELPIGRPLGFEREEPSAGEDGDVETPERTDIGVRDGGVETPEMSNADGGAQAQDEDETQRERSDADEPAAGASNGGCSVRAGGGNAVSWWWLLLLSVPPCRRRQASAPRRRLTHADE